MTQPIVHSGSDRSENLRPSVHLPIRFISKVIPGFGRGSKDLGIPTANISRKKATCALTFESLPCGIYWGFARIGEKKIEGSSQTNGSLGKTFKTAVSIGYNPTVSAKLQWRGG